MPVGRWIRGICAVAVVAVTGVLVVTESPAAAPCSQAPRAGTYDVAVDSQARTWSVLVDVPALAEGQTAPLVFNLHGSSQSGSAHRDSTGFAHDAVERGVIVAHPDGGVPGVHVRPPYPAAPPAGHFWNIPGMPLAGDIPVPPGSRDDVQFIRDAVATFVSELCADPSRVYATGASGGGRMASLLGCELADTVTAIAPVIGVRAGNPDPDNPSKPDPETCTPSSSMPVMAIHGAQDTQNPYDGGGSKYWGYGVPAAMARWAEIDRCSGPATVESVTDTVALFDWGTCAEGAEVQLYLSSANGHAWPGTDSPLNAAFGPVDQSISANELILDFFERHQR